MDEFNKRKIFKNFLSVILSFFFLSIFYIQLVVLKIKYISIIKSLKDKRKKVYILHSNTKDKYFKKSNLKNIEKEAKENLKMIYPDNVKYFKIKTNNFNKIP